MQARYSPPAEAGTPDSLVSGGDNPPPTQPPQPGEAPKMELTTLADWGARLPSGIYAAGARSRVFRVRPFRLKEEKEISLIKSGKGAKNLTHAQFVGEVLARMIHTVGPVSFDSLDHASRRLNVANLDFTDALYIYLYLRYETLGPDEPVTMATVCPNCRLQKDIDCELGTMKIRAVTGDPPTLRRAYNLRDGLMIRGQQCHTLYLEPMKWHHIERPDFANDKAAREAATLQYSIVGAEGIDVNPFMISDSEMDELTKFDMSGLTRDIEDNTPGPSMIVEHECERCNLDWKMPINWAYDSFYNRSSQSRSGRN